VAQDRGIRGMTDLPAGLGYDGHGQPISQGAARIGFELREARERLGWKLEDVSATLRIRYPYLLALEEGRFRDLPAPAYALGFLRTYAAALGLDAAEMAQRFRAEATEMNHKTHLKFPAPVSERGVPTGAMVLLGLVLATAGYAGWYWFSAKRPGPMRVTEVPEHLIAESNSALVTQPGGNVVAPAGNAGAPPPGSPTSAPAASGQPVLPETSATGAALPSSAAAAPVTEPRQTPSPPSGTDTGGEKTREQAASVASQPAAAPAPSAATASSALAAPPTPPASPPLNGSLTNPANAAAASAPEAMAHIVLRATSDAWVQVRDRQGHILLNRVLRPGETWTVPPQDPGQPPLLLTTGNAGGTELIVDGKPAPAIGGSGAVKRDLPLDAELIKRGKLPAQIAAAKAAGRNANATSATQ
jgi:cytoskeleton protein RodZ